MTRPIPTLQSEVQIVPAFTQIPYPPPPFYGYRTAENAPIWHGPTGYVVGAKYGDLVNDSDRHVCENCREWVLFDAGCSCGRTKPLWSPAPISAQDGESPRDDWSKDYASSTHPFVAFACFGCLLAVAVVLFLLGSAVIRGRHLFDEGKRQKETRSIYTQKGDMRVGKHR